MLLRSGCCAHAESLEICHVVQQAVQIGTLHTWQHAGLIGNMYARL
jgi:hypothetical protein